MTTGEVLRGWDLRGRRYAVTGGTSGLGEETVRALAAAGASVVFTARNGDRALATVDRIRAIHPSADVGWEQVDLLSLESVRRAGEELAARLERIDALVANAGIMGGPLSRSTEGFEAQLATNHLAHVVLVQHLLGALVDGGRVIVTSSSAHAYAGVDLDDLNFERRPYEGMVAYGQSKTANIMFASELDRRHRQDGLRAASVHPGSIKTDLGRRKTAADDAFIDDVLRRTARPRWKSVEQGAATQVWAAVVADPAEIGGRYLEDCEVAAVSTANEGLGPGVRPEALDAEVAAALWHRTAELLGDHNHSM